jgi:hypothetical protein
VNRRDFLRLAGPAAAGGLLVGSAILVADPEDRDTTSATGPGETAGTGGQRTPSTSETGENGPVTRHGISFDRTVGAVEDLGMDPSGETPVDEAVMDFLSREGELLELRPGTYTFEEDHAVDRVDRLGIVGLGQRRRDVVFRTPAEDGRFFIDVQKGGRGFLLENVTFHNGDGSGAIGNRFKIEDGLQVRNVEHTGFNPTDGNGGVDNLDPQVIDPDGRAVVDGLVRRGPTHIVSHGHLDGNSNEGVMWLGPKHEGELLIRNTHIANTGTNAIYARAATGTITVEGCTFVNNNQASIRIGGSGATVRDTDFVVDTDSAHPDNRGEYINPNGLVWETGDRGDVGGLVENCTFTYRSAPEKTKAALWADGSAGAFTVRGCRFEIGTPGVVAVRVDDPRDPRLGTTADRPWGVTVSDTVVEGPQPATGPLIWVTGRPETTVENVRLVAAGGPPAVRFIRSSESSFRNVSVSGAENWLNATPPDGLTLENVQVDDRPGPDSA